MRIYKLLIRPESGDACAILEAHGVMFRSCWLAPEKAAALEKNVDGLLDLDYPSENRVTEEFLRRFKIRASVVVGSGRQFSE